MTESTNAIPKRVVFDSSTLISAALRVGSLPHRALGAALESCTLCASEATLAEVEEVLMRPKFDRYQTRDVRLEFAAMLRQNTLLFEVDDADVVPGCRDQKDDKYLALVRECDAVALVSSDADLLTLHPWNGIPILSPKAFLEWVERSQPNTQE